jgi:hypothetical protein
MREVAKRGLREGVGFGLLAGLIFFVVEIIVAAVQGMPPLAPVRLFASTALGPAALSGPIGSVFVVGVLAHVVLSAIYGAIYGAINAGLSAQTETSYARQASLGLLFGAALWLVNFQIFSRLMYPWFLDASQTVQLVLHAVAYGLPLSLMYASAERTAQHVVRPAIA